VQENTYAEHNFLDSNCHGAHTHVFGLEGNLSNNKNFNDAVTSFVIIDGNCECRNVSPVGSEALIMAQKLSQDARIAIARAVDSGPARVNVNVSKRERSGIIRRQFCGGRRVAAIFRGTHDKSRAR
jgi:hypothetical protein